MANRVDQPARLRRELGWVLNIDAAAAGPGAEPLFLRIARAIGADIRRGRLAPDARLPGSRELARTLGVHRNTVLAAYRELVSEGWIEPRHGRGTFVSAQMPEIEPRSFRKAKRVTSAQPDAARGTRLSFPRGPAAKLEHSKLEA